MLDREEITVLQGRCQPYGRNIPYFPFIDSLRWGIRLREEDSPAELLEKAVTNIKAIDSSLEQFIPLYLHLLSIQSYYPLPAHLQGKELRKAMEEALAVIITLNTQHQPMVMILEDWHWSDDASQAAFEALDWHDRLLCIDGVGYVSAYLSGQLGLFELSHSSCY